MSYIYCDACGIGFHSNVHSCPECGRPASRTYDLDISAPRRARSATVREDVENEVRQAIYGWRSGTVELCGDAAPPVIAERPLTQPA